MFAAYASGASPEDTKQDAPAAAAPAGSYATAPDMQASGDDSTKSKRAKKAAKTAKTPPPASDTAPAPKVTVLGPSSSDLDVFRVVRGPSAAGAGSLQQRALASLSKRAALGDGPAAWGIDVRPDRDNVIFGAYVGRLSCITEAINPVILSFYLSSHARPYKKDIPLYRRVGHGRFLLGSAGLVNLPPPPEKTTAKTDSKGGDSKAQPAVVEATVNRYFTHRLKHRKASFCWG